LKDQTEVKYNLIVLFASPIDPAAQRKELNALIEECFKIATVQVRFQLSKLHKPGIAGDLSAKDIAVDAIAPLFTPASDGLIYHISDVLSVWEPAIQSEEQARFALISVIARRVKQHTHTLMRESDPFFAKILDSLNYHIKKEKLHKSEKLSVCYISKDDPSKVSLDYFHYDDLLKLSSSAFNIRHISVGGIIEELESDNEAPAAIPILALAKRVKEINLSFENPVLVCRETETDYDIEALSSTAMKHVLDKLRFSYLRKEKLSESEGLIIEKALGEIVFDLKDGGIKPGLYHYIEMIDNSINPEIYKSKYHNILEYLVKLMRKEFQHLLAVKR